LQHQKKKSRPHPREGRDCKVAEKMRPLEVFSGTGKAEVKQPKKWDTAVRSKENQYQHDWVWMQGTIYENLMRKFA
jgi:hypothetical protein